MNGMTSQARGRARLTVDPEGPELQSWAWKVDPSVESTATGCPKRQVSPPLEYPGASQTKHMPGLHPQLLRQFPVAAGPSATHRVFGGQKPTLLHSRDQKCEAEVLAGLPSCRLWRRLSRASGCRRWSASLQAPCLPGRSAFPSCPLLCGSLTRTRVMAFRARLGPFSK